MINWNSDLLSLYKKRTSKTCEKLMEAGYETLYDLLWLLPLKIYPTPLLKKFSDTLEDELIKGAGKVVSFVHNPSWKGAGKGRAPLSNATLIIKDLFSEDVIELKFFNLYPSAVEKIKKENYIVFQGTIQVFMAKRQIVNAKWEGLAEEEFSKLIPEVGIPIEIQTQYPTVNSVSNSHVKKVFQRIPSELWEQLPETLPLEIISNRNFPSLSSSFRLLHGMDTCKEWQAEKVQMAKERLIYEDFFEEQLKLKIRRKKLTFQEGPKLITNKLEDFETSFPYELTDGQKNAVLQVKKDFESGHPMMRLIQGDVGCGKTTVAAIASLITSEAGFQSALMCPTESLALQHFITLKPLFESHGFSIDLLVGSLKTKEKKEVNEKLVSGETDFIIGTHSLFQKDIKFKKLGLAIIDEQHKFGVKQRHQLVSKGHGTHCLIMTATPIPRSLSLTHYGDLEITTIKSIPGGRKGTQTRIVDQKNFPKFLNFLKTRLEMGEQAYIVVPAIEESENLDILNLESVLEKFKKLYPKTKVSGLHGKLSSEEKEENFIKFKNKEIELLISTSVIEVGIDNPNATVIAIMNPERFGLSSLHQLRGRVGRGAKPGFCFLVPDKKLSQESMKRLRVIESTTDGFKIAEEDLKLRGEGDLFGTDQSGSGQRRIASIITHSDFLLMAREDLEKIPEGKENPFLIERIQNFERNQLVTKTI